MQVEKTEVMPEAPNCMPVDPTVPEVSQLYINRSNDAHLYSLSLKQLEDAKKEIHKELSYPIRHTFLKKNSEQSQLYWDIQLHCLPCAEGNPSFTERCGVITVTVLTGSLQTHPT